MSIRLYMVYIIMIAVFISIMTLSLYNSNILTENPICNGLTNKDCNNLKQFIKDKKSKEENIGE